MTTEHVKILDREGKVVATAQVSDQGTYFGGSIDLRATPRELRRKFEEYEEIVSGQIFSLLDQIEEQIDGLALTVAFEDSRGVCVADLQIYPSTGRISFKAEKEAIQKRKGA
jgi:hypothetical protein